MVVTAGNTSFVDNASKIDGGERQQQQNRLVRGSLVLEKQNLLSVPFAAAKKILLYFQRQLLRQKLPLTNPRERIVRSITVQHMRRSVIGRAGAVGRVRWCSRQPSLSWSYG